MPYLGRRSVQSPTGRELEIRDQPLSTRLPSHGDRLRPHSPPQIRCGFQGLQLRFFLGSGASIFLKEKKIMHHLLALSSFCFSFRCFSGWKWGLGFVMGFGMRRLVCYWSFFFGVMDSRFGLVLVFFFCNRLQLDFLVGDFAFCSACWSCLHFFSFSFLGSRSVLDMRIYFVLIDLW